MTKKSIIALNVAHALAKRGYLNYEHVEQTIGQPHWSAWRSALNDLQATENALPQNTYNYYWNNYQNFVSDLPDGFAQFLSVETETDNIDSEEPNNSEQTDNLAQDTKQETNDGTNELLDSKLELKEPDQSEELTEDHKEDPPKDQLPDEEPRTKEDLIKEVVERGLLTAKKASKLEIEELENLLKQDQ